MNISVIIPALNNKPLLEKNLPKVLAALNEVNNSKKQIIISDDNSNDGTLEYLNSLKTSFVKNNIELIAITNKSQRGFSSNVTNAISYAKGDILLLLNTDVSPTKNFINPLLKHFSDASVFAVGCLEETKDESGTEQTYGRSKGYFKKGFIMHMSQDAFKGKETFWVSCGSGAFRKKIWDSLGGLDKLYNPFYWEDIDLSYRAVKSGYKIVFEPQSVVEHQHEEGAIKTSFKKTTVNKIVYRNQFHFFWKNVTDGNLILKHLLWLPYHIVNSVLNGDINFLQGLGLAILRYPSTKKARAEAKKLFKLSDDQILKQFS